MDPRVRPRGRRHPRRRRRGGAGSPQGLHRPALSPRVASTYRFYLCSKLGSHRAPSPPRPLPASGPRASPSTPPAAGAGGRQIHRRWRGCGRGGLRVDGGFWSPSLERKGVKRVGAAGTGYNRSGRLRTLPCGVGEAGAHASA